MWSSVVDPVMFEVCVQDIYKVRNFGNLGINSRDFIAKSCTLSTYNSSPFENTFGLILCPKR